MNAPAPKTSPDAALGNLMAAALDVPSAPEQPAVPDDTLARTGNTADHQAGWFAGIDHARAEARESAGVGAQQLQERADKVVIANATSNPDLFQEAVRDLLAAVRMFRPAPAAGDALAGSAPEWATCESRGPWARNSLTAAIDLLREKETRARHAFTKDYMGLPARYIADAYGEAAAVVERKLGAIAAQRKGDA